MREFLSDLVKGFLTVIFITVMPIYRVWMAVWNWIVEVPDSLKKIAKELEKLNKSWEGKK